MKANKFYLTEIPDLARIPDIKNSIRSHEGVNSVRIDTQASSVTVDYDEFKYSEDDIRNLVNAAGLTVTDIR